MTTRVPIALLCAALSAAVLAAHPSTAARGALSEVEGQQPPPASPPPPAQQGFGEVTFRVEVNYVEVDAVVTDAAGTIVTDLTQADFEVLEDGRPQKVTAFSLVNLPIERPVRPLFAGGPIEPDVSANTIAEGRIYVIVLDDLHTNFTSTARVRQFLRAFLENDFGTNDLAAVVYTSGRATSGQEFTSNRRLLLQAVDRFSGQKLRSEALELADELARRTEIGSLDPGSERDLRLLDPLEAERAHHARSMLRSLRDLAAFMEGIRGRRKSILLISEGISYNVYDVFNYTSAGIILQDASDAVAAATRANTAVYAIDPRGLSAFEEAIESAGTPSGVTPSQFSLIGQLESSLRLSQQSLQVLADQTGGFAAINRNDFGGAFARVVRENSSYYVLGYYPTNDRRDGRFRRIEVRVKRPGLQVRARRGYVAPRGRAPNTRPPAGATPLDVATGSALNSPIPVTGVPLSLSAAAFKGTAPNASVSLVLEMRADAFRFTEKAGTFLDRVQVAFSAVDAAGKTHPGSKHVLGMEMSAATAALARERGFRVVSEIALPPGRYQLRASTVEEGANRSGSVFHDIEIPDFYKAPFAMSGVALASASTSATPTVRPSEALKDVLPGPLATGREFPPNDQIALFAEFYENAPNAPPHTIELATTARAEDGRVVFQNREQRSSADLQGTSGGYGYSVRLPLTEFAPGPYVIRVEGRSVNNATAAREVLIRVR
ncbi:MAG: VWA domain-containing protein [Acidobacteria bacterium]|nr:VWA domain-containing protein [Acidobacteriota bacterium]